MLSSKIKILALFSFLLCFSPAAMGAVSPAPSTRQVLKAAGGLQLPFVANQGQVKDPAIAFMADTFACRVAVSRDGEIVYSRATSQKDSGAPMQITERLVNAQVNVSGRDQQAARVSYFPGRDKTRWHTNLPTYGRVTVGHITPKIRVDLKAHGDSVEKFFYLQPGADPASIRLAVSGAEGLKVDADGEMVLTTASGSMHLSKPIAYQEIDGERRSVPVCYALSRNTYSFEVGKYDASRELVIDPLVRVFAIKHGDQLHNAFMDVVSDDDGNVYAAGYTRDQLVIYKLDRYIKTILGAAFFSKGGEYHGDIIRSMALDSQGHVFVVGKTENLDFPLTPGCADNQPDPMVITKEGFVAKFSADLVTLMAATYLGGDNYEHFFDVAIDARDRVYVAGCSETTGLIDGKTFPVTSTAYDTIPAPEYQIKAVVARLDNDLSTIEAATFLGGSEDDNLNKKADVANCLSISSDGEVSVAGLTNQADFPTTADSISGVKSGDGDIFLARFDADLTQLLYSTFIGGGQDEAPTDLLLNTAGELYMTGWTFSADFPMTSDGYDTSHGLQEEDGFILKLNASGNEILAATFLGGTHDTTSNGDDIPAGIALSTDETQLAVVGRTESRSFPTTPNAYSTLLDAVIAEQNGKPFDYWYYNILTRDDRDDPDGGDGFVSVFSSDLTQLLYSTFIGSKNCDYLDAVCNNGGDILAVGQTQGANFPLAPPDDGSSRPRAMLLRIGADDGPDSPGGDDEPPGDDTPSGDDTTPRGDSGSGGGGCFIRCIRP